MADRQQRRGALIPTIRLIRIWGFPIRIHWSFFILVLGILIWSRLTGHTIIESVWHLGILFTVFICVVLHECGHALAARNYHVPIRDILILPIGGLARLEYIPKRPVIEMVIAIAGPLVNLFLALTLTLIYITFLGYPLDVMVLEDLTSTRGLIFGLALINFTLFFFNLIPAYPMDGGRILRALLSIRWGRYRATLWASYIAQLISFVFIIWGYFHEAFTLMLIGIFIFMTARWERRYLIEERSLEEE